MKEVTIGYRIYTNYEGGDDTLYVVNVTVLEYSIKGSGKTFYSTESLEAALKEAEAWRSLYLDGLIDEDDFF
ncbi:hypothetical protein [Xanthocytophaga agilis]|uniref:Uncharacterized protein n=1 Tax=Xanthocytophaga agilis TaxID=3048010 RepID=A0AAE3R4Q1_9BACT|nr:hypothetical protein [Xanthocytophaga agilis]MDJ1501537.1 hypothetical protein [Xanthocytophaga agilis]